MALKDELIQKALRRSKPTPMPGATSKYSHFKIYEVPPIENNENTKNKQDTKQAQTEHKAGYKPSTEQDTNRTQTEYRKNIVFKNRTQTEHATGHKVEHKEDTNRTQTEHESILEVENFCFSSYVGLQRDILLLFYSDCKTSRSRETQELSLQHVANSLNIRIGSVKTSIRRLEEKGAIKRIKFKNGRSGWSSYELQEHIYREIIHYEAGHKLDTKWVQTGHKLNTKLDTQPDTNLSSSSGNSNIIETTTTGDNSNVTLPEEWQVVSIDPLSDFGFTQTHLVQIIQQGKLAPALVQDSIQAFAFDLKRNDRAKALKTHPINYFMGILRNGQPYAPPGNYESPHEEAMRLYVERQQELEKKRAELEKTAFDLAFNEWFVNLSEDEKNSLLSPFVKHLKSDPPKLAALREHFREKIWTVKRAEIIHVPD